MTYVSEPVSEYTGEENRYSENNPRVSENNPNNLKEVL